MRVVIAMMQHETNTFSTVPPPLARFSPGNVEPVPMEGRAAPDAFRGTGTALGAFIELPEAEGHAMVVLLAARARASGPVEEDRKSNRLHSSKECANRTPLFACNKRNP